MQASLINKLQALVDRRAEIERELSDPAVAADADRFKRLSQEYAGLGPSVEAFAAWQAVLSEIDDLQAMQRDPDEEMRAIAKQELEDAQTRRAALEQQLQLAL